MEMCENSLSRKEMIQLFPWIISVKKRFSKSFPNDYDSDTLNFFHMEIEKELETISINSSKRNEALFSTLISFYNHFCWKIKWRECSQDMKVSCGKLLSSLSKVGLILTEGNIESKWLSQVLSAIKVFPGDSDLLYDALLHINRLKSKYQAAYGVILKSTLCCGCGQVNHEEPATYFKLMFLYRRLKVLSKEPHERAGIVSLAAKAIAPGKTKSWLISNNLHEFCEFKRKDIGQKLMKKTFNKEMLKKLRDVILPNASVPNIVLKEESGSDDADISNQFFIDSQPEIEDMQLTEMEGEMAEDIHAKPLKHHKKKLKKHNLSVSSVHLEGELPDFEENSFTNPEPNNKRDKPKRKSAILSGDSTDCSFSAKKTKLDSAKKSCRDKINKVDEKWVVNEIAGYESPKVIELGYDEAQSLSSFDSSSHENANNSSSSHKKLKKNITSTHAAVSLNEINDYCLDQIPNESKNNQPDFFSSVTTVESSASKKKKKKTAFTTLEELQSPSNITAESLGNKAHLNDNASNCSFYIDTTPVTKRLSTKLSKKKNQKSEDVIEVKKDYLECSLNAEKDVELKTPKKSKKSICEVDGNLVTQDAFESSLSAAECSTSKKRSKRKLHQKTETNPEESCALNSEILYVIDNEGAHSLRKNKKRKSKIEKLNSSFNNNCNFEIPDDLSSKIITSDKQSSMNELCDADKQLPKTNISEERQSLTQKTLSNTQHSKVDEAKEIFPLNSEGVFKTQSFSNVKHAVKHVKDINTIESDSVESNEEPDAVESIVLSDAVESIVLSDAVESIPESDAVKCFVESDAVGSVVESDAVESVVDSDTVEYFVESDAVESIVLSDAVESIVLSDAVESIVLSDAVEPIVESGAAESIVEPDTAELIAESDVAEYTVESDADKFIVKSDAVEYVVESDTVESIANSGEVPLNALKLNVKSDVAESSANSDAASITVHSINEPVVVQSINELKALKNNSSMPDQELDAAKPIIDSDEVDIVFYSSEPEPIVNAVENSTMPITDLNASRPVVETNATETVVELHEVELTADSNAADIIIERSEAEPSIGSIIPELLVETNKIEAVVKLDEDEPIVKTHVNSIKSSQDESQNFWGEGQNSDSKATSKTEIKNIPDKIFEHSIASDVEMNVIPEEKNLPQNESISDDIQSISISRDAEIQDNSHECNISRVECISDDILGSSKASDGERNEVPEEKILSQNDCISSKIQESCTNNKEIQNNSQECNLSQVECIADNILESPVASVVEIKVFPEGTHLPPNGCDEIQESIPSHTENQVSSQNCISSEADCLSDKISKSNEIADNYKKYNSLENDLHSKEKTLEKDEVTINKFSTQMNDPLSIANDNSEIDSNIIAINGNEVSQKKSDTVEDIAEALYRKILTAKGKPLPKTEHCESESELVVDVDQKVSPVEVEVSETLYERVCKTKEKAFMKTEDCDSESICDTVVDVCQEVPLIKLEVIEDIKEDSCIYNEENFPEKSAADILTENTVSYVMEQIMKKVEFVNYVPKECSSKIVEKSDVKCLTEENALLETSFNLKPFGCLKKESDSLSFVDFKSEPQENESLENYVSADKGKNFFPYRRISGMDVPDDKSESNFSDVILYDKIEETLCESEDSTSSDSENEAMEINDNFDKTLLDQTITEEKSVKNSLSEGETESTEMEISESSENNHNNHKVSPKVCLREQNKSSVLSDCTATTEISDEDHKMLIGLVQTLKVPVINLGSRCDNEYQKHKDDAPKIVLNSALKFNDESNSLDETITSNTVSDCMHSNNNEGNILMEVNETSNKQEIIENDNQLSINTEMHVHDQNSKDTEGDTSTNAKEFSSFDDDKEPKSTRRLRKRNVQSKEAEKSESNQNLHSIEKRVTPEEASSRQGRKPSSTQNTESMTTMSDTKCRSSKRLKKVINDGLQKEFRDLSLNSPKSKRRNLAAAKVEDEKDRSGGSGETLKVERRATRSSRKNVPVSKSTEKDSVNNNTEPDNINSNKEEAVKDNLNSSRRSSRLASSNKFYLNAKVKQVNDNSSQKQSKTTRSPRLLSRTSEMGDLNSKASSCPMPLIEESDNEDLALKSSEENLEEKKHSSCSSSVASEKECSNSKADPKNKTIDEESNGEDVDCSSSQESTIEKPKVFGCSTRASSRTSQRHGTTSKNILNLKSIGDDSNSKSFNDWSSLDSSQENTKVATRSSRLRSKAGVNRIPVEEDSDGDVRSVASEEGSLKENSSVEEPKEFPKSETSGGRGYSLRSKRSVIMPGKLNILKSGNCP